MGYRARLGKIPKKEKDKFDGKNYDESKKLLSEGRRIHTPDSYTQLIELGKYFNFKKGEINFYSFDIYKECESEFYIMTKENLKELIYDYHENIHIMYERLAKGLDDRQKFLNSKVREWDNKFIDPYYLDEEDTDGEIVKSWSYEYSIFNLVYIYRTFDWKNDYLIYSAW